mmetsp:Transcript_26613/g.70469  ORF Transcript_26613/g.70469 Transcript_26613/m.70469 type:complete len:225 (-) Transcript_26613:69-743(-)
MPCSGEALKSSSTSTRNGGAVAAQRSAQLDRKNWPMSRTRSAGSPLSLPQLSTSVRASNWKGLPRCAEMAPSSFRTLLAYCGQRQVDDSTTVHRGPAASMSRARRHTSRSLSPVAAGDSSLAQAAPSHGPARRLHVAMMRSAATRWGHGSLCLWPHLARARSALSWLNDSRAPSGSRIPRFSTPSMSTKSRVSGSDAALHPRRTRAASQPPASQTATGGDICSC